MAYVDGFFESLGSSCIYMLGHAGENDEFWTKVLAAGSLRDDGGTDVDSLKDQRWETTKGRSTEGGKHGRKRSQDVTALKEMGISKMESSRWQQETKVPEKEFERYVSDKKDSGDEMAPIMRIKVAD